MSVLQFNLSFLSTTEFRLVGEKQQFGMYLLMITVLLLDAFTIEGLDAAATAGASPGCASCALSMMEKGSEEKLLIEIAKQQILKKLHLKERPNITSTVPRAALMTALRKLHAGRVKQDGTLELDANMNTHSRDQAYEIVSFADMGKNIKIVSLSIASLFVTNFLNCYASHLLKRVYSMLNV